MTQRMHIALRGAVQGVGFRPFVFRLADQLGLKGWVLNSPQGVFIEIEGEKAVLDDFLLRLQQEKPARSFIQSLEYSLLDPANFKTFEIRESESTGVTSALILPDIATCAECLSEIFDPGNRRYLYPFTNCTHCGPRFTIIESLPYDRPNTSMKAFKMCVCCQQEYENPGNRRFHAQPNACPDCGPSLELWDGVGNVIHKGNEAVSAAAESIRASKIVAIKGIGGFHLVADASNSASIARLRERKHREEKPFALMYPSIERLKEDCRISSLEARLLLSAESPIVLLERKPKANIAPAVGPGNPYIGAMLPYAPVHHILMRALGSPIVATSGNLSDEPICIDEKEALKRLAGIADLFLVHNRPIVRHVDDSIVRIVLDRELVMRRARGYAPLPIRVKDAIPGILAVGGHLKNSIALSVENNVFVSQHIGDLENRESLGAFQKAINSFRNLYQINPTRLAADMHPDYLSTKYAKESGIPVIQVQHHYAHVLSCMAENELDGRVLGVSWDGTGFGLEGSIWGGEFLLTNEKGFVRTASFRKFRLPGSAAAIKQPRRTAIGVLYEIFGDKLLEEPDLPSVKAFSNQELTILIRMLQKGIQSPWTSSAGRLFDAVASLAGLRQQIKFEGQAAMELEFAIEADETEEAYPFILRDSEEPMIFDWAPMVLAILEDSRQKISLAKISRKFHNTLVEVIIQVAKRTGEDRVVLSGGCFQNRVLLENSARRLRAEGFRPYWHQRIPTNDGGISLGQVVAASLECASLLVP